MPDRYRSIRSRTEVEAVQWTGEDNCSEVFAFLGLDHPDDELDHSRVYAVPTPEGGVDVRHGDWIVRTRRPGLFEVHGEIEFTCFYGPVADGGES